MTYEPREYQRKAIAAMLAGPGYGLLLDPGMGKTSSTLAALQALRDGGHMRAALVVSPIRPARNVWPQEVQKWGFNLRVSLVLGSVEQRMRALHEIADIYVINPENVAWYAELNDSGHGPDVLVIDESTKFKNPSSIRFKSLRRILPRFSRRYILTGTPAPQSLMDLWSQTYLLDNGQRLGRYVTHFRETYFNEVPQRGGYSLWTLKPGADEQIFAKVSDIVMRLDARDHLDMPDRVENRIVVDLPPNVMQQYRQLERDFLLRVKGGTVTAANAAVVSTKLRQVANGAVYYDSNDVSELHYAKLEALQDLIEEQSGQPIIVAVAFAHDVTRIRRYLKDSDIPYLGGGMTSRYADDVIARWNRGTLPVLLAHPASVAHGLNLQSGGHALAWYGLTWSLEDKIQLEARVWRQGQTQTCQFHYLVARDTVDELVLAALSRKDAVQGALFTLLKEKANGVA